MVIVKKVKQKEELRRWGKPAFPERCWGNLLSKKASFGVKFSIIIDSTKQIHPVKLPIYKPKLLQIMKLIANSYFVMVIYPSCLFSISKIFIRWTRSRVFAPFLFCLSCRTCLWLFQDNCHIESLTVLIISIYLPSSNFFLCNLLGAQLRILKHFRVLLWNCVM